MLNRQLVFTNTTITVDGASVGAAYAIPFGDPNLYINELVGFFTITGTPTLSNSLSITNTGNPVSPIVMTFVSTAAINLNGNTVTIFGLSLTQTQASNPFTITVAWNGSSWQTPVLARIEVPPTGLPNSQLAEMDPYTFKMNSGGTSLVPQDVGLEEAAALLNVQYDHIWFISNFNSGAISPGSYRQDILIPYAGEATRIFGYVMETLGGVDDANISFGIASSAGGGASEFYGMTLPANTSANNVVTVLQAAFTGASTFSANYYLSVESTKSTWGGQVMFTVVTKRTV